MTAEAALATRSWRVGRWTCTMTIPKPQPGQALQACVEWSPALPSRTLSAALLAEYRTGRHAALESIAAELEISVAVVDL